MLAPNLNSIIHLAGFGAGIALYGLLAVMTRSGSRGGERLSFATALLGLAWNAGALVVFGTEDLGATAAPAGVSFIAYSALGFLPAVAVHAAVGYHGLGARRILVGAAYALAAVATLWQLSALVQQAEVPARSAMLMLTVGNLALVAALALGVRGDRGPRDVSSVALAVFAVMALHLSHHADVPESWVVAVLGHHASLPLALAILYQDYRFALADVFLKRALTILAVIILAAGLLWGVGLPWLSSASSQTVNPAALFVVLLLWVATALATPWIAARSSDIVDRLLLRRQAPRAMAESLAVQVSTIETPDEVLDAGCRAVADALAARQVAWREITEWTERTAMVLHDRGQSATVHIPTTTGPDWAIDVRELAGGRRLLSGDGTMLEAAAIVLGRRIDALRLARERLSRDLREESLLRLSSEAELQALRAQLNPHFLFNALTTLGFLMTSAPARAQETLYSLTALLRAVLTRTAREQNTLHEEMALVRDYLSIEQARFEERLGVHLDMPEALANARVPSLLLQPLVENAIKHGISPLARGGRVEVTAQLDGAQLVLAVRDTGRGIAPRDAIAGFGVGLSNLERRLERLYGGEASLTLESAPDRGTTVMVRIPFRAAGPEVVRAAS